MYLITAVACLSCNSLRLYCLYDMHICFVQVLRKSHTSGCNYFKTRSGTTLIGIMLPNGIVIGSDGRGTIEDIDGRDLIGEVLIC